ncbi:MAG: glycerol-3-phosphate dehydrogenase/oxidase [Candidatus Sericytochromatia bacterium]|nr:glycerol-3-phosphate dehydrogenase/oxidase [Candidatus Sericytochromatia bacterium]
MSLSALDRSTHLARIPASPYDLVVVGGGIVGAAAAWDAASRGLRTLLVEKGDFASGASSKSSKLLHGGLRYLEMGHVGLVYESLSQRNHLFHDATHVADRVKFLFPVFRGSRPLSPVLRLGLLLYDLLSHVTFPGGPWHRRLGAIRARQAEPALKAGGLLAAFTYEDGVTEDARLVIETLKSAVAAGADVLNHARVVAFERDARGHVRGVCLQDELEPQAPPLVATAGRVLLAVGPWTDALLRLDDPQAQPRLRPTKGAHLLVRAMLTDHAVLMRSADPNEGKPRLMFAVPWQGRTLLGTTDTDPVAADPARTYLDADCEVSREETRYILDAANATFGVQLTPADVVSSFAGWRPLVAPPTAGLSASAVSREHEIFETPSGLLAVAGGKLTSYRTMARQAVDRAVKRLEPARRAALAPTNIERSPVSGSELAGCSLEAWVEAAAADGAAPLAPAAVRTLSRRYGSNWPVLRELLLANPSLAAPLDASAGEAHHWHVEVVYAMTHEGAALPEDFLMRRTRLYLVAEDQGLGVLPAVTATMAAELVKAHGWSDERRARWVEQAQARYEAAVARGRASRAASASS